MEIRGKSYYDLRKRLEAEEIIKNSVFMQDYEFNALSAASAVILGRTSNGNIDWKTSDGRTLKDL